MKGAGVLINRNQIYDNKNRRLNYFLPPNPRPYVSAQERDQFLRANPFTNKTTNGIVHVDPIQIGTPQYS